MYVGILIINIEILDNCDDYKLIYKIKNYIMVIYKILNLINGKIYIGKTINDKDNYFGSGVLIKRSIKKYGIENFKKEIIDNAETIEELNEKEKYWISECKSNDLNIGYNISAGGDGGDLITNNPKKEDFLQYCRNRKGEKNGMYGKNHTAESLELMSKNRKGKCKGKPTWNKGLTKSNYSKEYIIKLCDKKGDKNPMAKKYRILSPNNEKFIINGELDKFAISKNFSPTTLRYFVNKGIIPFPNRKCSIERKNMIGWRIDLIT